jgi:hypothetical protein
VVRIEDPNQLELPFDEEGDSMTKKSDIVPVKEEPIQEEEEDMTGVDTEDDLIDEDDDDDFEDDDVGEDEDSSEDTGT